WMHNGMITFGADKMSKSLGNVLSIAEVTERAPGEALRLLYFGTHYRGPLERLYEALARADELLGPVQKLTLEGALATPDSPFLQSFCAAMDEDLNAAMALGFVFDRMRELNRALDAGDRPTVTAARSDLLRAGAALGLF